MRETQVRSLGREDLLEKEMATHSSILAGKIPWTEDPGRLQSMGSQRVGHDWATSLHFHKNTKLSLFPLPFKFTFSAVHARSVAASLPVSSPSFKESTLKCIWKPTGEHTQVHMKAYRLKLSSQCDLQGLLGAAPYLLKSHLSLLSQIA